MKTKIMKKILICTILVFLLVSCKKREYVHENYFCIHKNYFTPDTIPFDISGLTQPIDSSISQPNKVINAFNFIHNKNIKINKIQDSLYQFLHKKYLECCAEHDMNTYGLDDYEREHIAKPPKSGCYYFCGNLSLTPKVQSLVFLEASAENTHNYTYLILFNIKENKLRSMIKLSSYDSEEKEEDVSFKTYLIFDKQINAQFIAIESPYDNYQEVENWGLANENNKITFKEFSRTKKLCPYYYYSFHIGRDGYIILTPTMHKLNNINIINKEGRINQPRFIM